VGALGLKKRLRPDGRAKDSVVVLIRKGERRSVCFCWAREALFGMVEPGSGVRFLLGRGAAFWLIIFLWRGTAFNFNYWKWKQRIFFCWFWFVFVARGSGAQFVFVGRGSSFQFVFDGGGNAVWFLFVLRARSV